MRGWCWGLKAMNLFRVIFFIAVVSNSQDTKWLWHYIQNVCNVFRFCTLYVRPSEFKMHVFKDFIATKLYRFQHLLRQRAYLTSNYQNTQKTTRTTGLFRTKVRKSSPKNPAPHQTLFVASYGSRGVKPKGVVDTIAN